MLIITRSISLILRAKLLRITVSRDMNKRDLITRLSQSNNITKREADKFITSMLEIIIDTVSQNDKVMLVGFGSFSSRNRLGRLGRNPKTGEPIVISPSRVPVFSAGKFFIEKINQR